jgi:hypothetical protein
MPHAARVSGKLCLGKWHMRKKRRDWFALLSIIVRTAFLLDGFRFEM